MFMIILSTIAFLVGLGVTFWLHSQHYLDIVVRPRPVPDEEAASYPLISMIIPARNEARNIQRSVKALLNQTYPNFELIVLNDRSTDETAQVLADLKAEPQELFRSFSDADRWQLNLQRMQVIEGQELPPGWAGKPHALIQGAEAARGEWLCFIDADTFGTPDMLYSAYQTALEYQADLFSIMTRQELGTFWEKVILPIVFTALSFGFPAKYVNDPKRPDAICNGQFILIRSKVYNAIGGHRAIKNRIDEDKAIAEKVKGAGYRLILADGQAVAATRMYTSLPEMWEGWTKNMFLGLRDRLPLLLLGAVMGMVGALLLPLWLIAGIGWLLLGGGLYAAIVAGESLLLWVYLLYQRSLAARAFHISPLYAFTLPLGALVFTAMLLVSAFKVLSGQGVTWRGRTYKDLS